MSIIVNIDQTVAIVAALTFAYIIAKWRAGP